VMILCQLDTSINSLETTPNGLYADKRKPTISQSSEVDGEMAMTANSAFRSCGNGFMTQPGYGAVIPGTDSEAILY